MPMTTETPRPPLPPQPPGPRPPEPELPGYLSAPLVPVEPRWEYHVITRDAAAGALPSEAELNQMGREEWELTGVVTTGGQVTFYFKRARYP